MGSLKSNSPRIDKASTWKLIELRTCRLSNQLNFSFSLCHQDGVMQ